MTHRSDHDVPLEELLAGYVLGDCTEEESALVHEYLKNTDHRELLSDLETTVAAAQLAFYSDVQSEDLPNAIREKILLDARKHVRAADAGEQLPLSVKDSILESTFTESSYSANAAETAETVKARRPESPVDRLSRREMFAWLACAAAIFLALGIGLGKQSAVDLKLTEKRNRLLNGDGNVIVADWSNGTTPFETDVTGDVVWDNSSQTGFLRFVGMPENDPSLNQYQLWIIDPGRDDEPIDGGVFDISGNGEVIVEIDAKLQVVNPQAFAITIEKPGGVVVSTQENLPLLATMN